MVLEAGLGVDDKAQRAATAALRTGRDPAPALSSATLAVLGGHVVLHREYTRVFEKPPIDGQTTRGRLPNLLRQTAAMRSAGTLDRPQCRARGAGWFVARKELLMPGANARNFAGRLCQTWFPELGLDDLLQLRAACIWDRCATTQRELYKEVGELSTLELEALAEGGFPSPPPIAVTRFGGRVFDPAPVEPFLRRASTAAGYVRCVYGAPSWHHRNSAPNLLADLWDYVDTAQALPTTDLLWLEARFQPGAGGHQGVLEPVLTAADAQRKRRRPSRPPIRREDHAEVDAAVLQAFVADVAERRARSSCDLGKLYALYVHWCDEHWIRGLDREGFLRLAQTELPVAATRLPNRSVTLQGIELRQRSFDGPRAALRTEIARSVASRLHMTLPHETVSLFTKCVLTQGPLQALSAAAV